MINIMAVNQFNQRLKIPHGCYFNFIPAMMLENHCKLKVVFIIDLAPNQVEFDFEKAKARVEKTGLTRKSRADVAPKFIRDTIYNILMASVICIK